MLTILRDPAGITGRECHAWDYGRTLQENIAAHLAGGADAVLTVNGVDVDPLTDPRLDAPPSALDRVTVTLRPNGVETWLLVASLALSVYSIATRPDAPPDSLVGKDSPNNRLTGQTNIARAYQAIPDVYGTRRVWPDLIQPSLTEYIGNLKYVTEWLCISRGKGDVTDIKFSETPIADIDGSSTTLFEPSATPSAYPELNTTTLVDVFEPFESPEVNGQELAYSVLGDQIAVASTVTDFGLGGLGIYVEIEFPDSSAFDDLKAFTPGAAVYVQLSVGGVMSWQRDVTAISYSTGGGFVTFRFESTGSAGDLTGVGLFAYDAVLTVSTPGSTSATTVGPVTTPIANATDLWWNIVFLRGLKGTVRVRAEWWQVNAGGTEISGTRQLRDDTFTADTFDQQFYTLKATPAAGAGRYRIQFTRLTPDLGNGADIAKLEEVFSIRKFATKTLPGVTVMKVTTQATAQATGFRDRKFNVIFARHVRTLTSTTLSASRNFARSMAHVWSLAGEDIAELDTTALAAINASLGETSPLLRFDGSLDDADMSLGERLQRIAFHARCQVWRDGVKWTVTRDQARTVPDVQLDYRNLAAGGDSAISYAAHLPASNDGVELEYVGETTQTTKAYVRLKITAGVVSVGAPQNPLKVKMPGCVTDAQAVDRAHLEARRLMYQRTTVRDTALADAGGLGIDSLVRWIDPNDFGGVDEPLQAGEVLSIAGTTITTSEPLDWHGETSGRMLFTGVDGLTLGAPIVVTPGPGEAVTLASAPAGLYVRDGVTRQLGSRYTFAVGLTDAELQAAGLYVVKEVSPNADRTVSLTLVNYDARMYSDVTVLGIASETDTAQPMTSRLRRTIGQATETDSAQAMTRV